MFGLRARKGFCKSVSGHFVGGAINEFDVSSFDDVPDIVVANIDVFCAGIVESGFRECDGTYAVTTVWWAW
jgi:hypothetical protein